MSRNIKKSPSLKLTGHKNKGKKNDAPVFSLPLKDNIEDLMQSTDGKYKLLSKVSPVNGDLLSTENLGKVSDAITGALSTFDGRVGIYISSEKVNVDKNMDNIEEFKKSVSNELKVDWLDDQKSYLSSMANKCKNVLNFYVALETAAKNYASAESLLTDSFRGFKNELESANIFAYQYRGDEIKELLYKRMNPDQSEYAPYNPEWGLNNIVPQNIKRYDDGLHLGVDSRVYRFYKITKYPRKVTEFRWLRRLLKINGDINIAFTLTPKSKKKLLDSLSGAYDELEGKALAADKEHVRQNYEMDADSAQKLITKISADNAKLYDVNCTIGISAPTMEELNTLSVSFVSAVSASGCQCSELKYKDYNPYYVTLPILADNFITRNDVWNFSNDDIGSMILFDSSEYMETRGTLIGENDTSRGIVIVNYYNKHYNNSHMTIIADSGSGKTYFLMADAIRNFPYVDYTFMFDIKGDLYFPWAKRFNFNATSGIVTNPFHIRHAIIDTDNVYEMGKADVGVYLAQKIMDLIVFFKWILRNMDTDMESLLEEDIRDAYLAKGLSFESKELPVDAAGFPTLSTLGDVIKDKIAHSDDEEEKTLRRRILRGLKPYIDGAYSKMFNGATNWDFHPFTVFGLTNLPDAVKLPLYDLLLKEVWQFCKKDGTKNPPIKRVYVDEAHEFADEKNPQTLIFLSTKMSKQGRGFGVSLITATQNLPDFLSIPRHGQAIIDNAYFKFFMRLGESDLPVAEKLYRFSASEMKIIQGNNLVDKGTKGKGIFIIGSQRVVVQTRASKNELEIIDPVEYEKIYGKPSRYFGSYIQHKDYVESNSMKEVKNEEKVS